MATEREPLARFTDDLERQRIADRLRQGPGQVLANVLVEMRALLTLQDVGAESLRNFIEALASELEEGYWELQEIVDELRPPFLLREAGLLPWLEAFAERYQQRYGLQVHFHVEDGTELPIPARFALCRVVQEALRNVREHAQASDVSLRLYRHRDEVVLEIRDNGRGLDVEELNGQYRAIHPKETFGLLMMRYWLQQVGGSLRVFSGENGGTVIQAAVPHTEEVTDAGSQTDDSPHDRGGPSPVQRGPETGSGNGRRY